MYDIIIPSCKPYSDLQQHVSLIREYDSVEHNYIPTGFQASAAVNRNVGLAQAKNDIIIMIDDDIGGFYEGWQDDLVAPLSSDPNLKIVSARLMTPDGMLSPMMGVSSDLSSDLIVVPEGIQFKKYRFGAILSAAIAFRRTEAVDFNNHFVGSGFEDTFFCFQMSRKFPGCKFACNNKCQLIHYHEMKNQNNHLKENEEIFNRLIALELEHE